MVKPAIYSKNKQLKEAMFVWLTEVMGNVLLGVLLLITGNPSGKMSVNLCHSSLNLVSVIMETISINYMVNA